jgi:hypothetical protein
LEASAILLTSIISVLHDSVTDTISDEVTANIYRKSKLLLAKTENSDYLLDLGIENSIIEGYYFALYFCVDECRRKAKSASDRSLLIELNNIEDIIGGKQKSDNAAIKKIFSDNGGITLFIGGGVGKDKADDLVYKLLNATFDKIYLPREFKIEADHYLFDKVKSYFSTDIRSNSILTVLLDKLLVLLKDDLGGNVTIQIREKLKELFKPRYSGFDSSFDVRIQLIRKFGSLYGTTPLKEVSNINLSKCSDEMLALYRSWERKNSDNTNTYYGKRKDDFINAPKAKEENRTEQFIVGDDITNGLIPARLFYVISRSESPFSLYPLQAEEIDNEPKRSKVYRTYQVNTSCKIGDFYNVVSVLLYADHALIQTVRLKNGGFIEAFSDSKRVEYVHGNDEADFGARELEAEVCFSVDNPLKVLTFIDVREKCIVNSKIKYDYQLEAKYGSLTLLRNNIYLAIQLNFAREGESVQALDFYNALREESTSEYIPLQFALIVKNRLAKIFDLYNGKFAQDVLKYSRELFCWTTLSAGSDHLESEMDGFISYISEILKKEKDITNILGLSDLQACAVYNKSLANKRDGKIDKAITYCEQAVQIIKMIKSIQPDYPTKKDLDFYEAALIKLKK